MSEYSYVMDLIQDNNFELKEKEKNNHQPESFNNDEYQDLSNNEPTVFDLQKFGQELYEKSYLKNKNYFEYASNINAYDVTSGCIRSTIFKLLKVPTKSYADKWLPLAMRSTIGNAIHDFIQLNSKQFTEKEVVLKVPSLHFSGRADGLINNNVLVEIKSVPYNDYKRIVSTKKPRIDDFYQGICYKYMIENYLDEIKKPENKSSRGIQPILDSYNIKYVQFIYVAHELLASDVEDIDEALKSIRELKQKFNSRRNQFFFITQLCVDVEESNQYITYIKDKIYQLNYFLQNNKIPPLNDPYIDTNRCFFCLFQQKCRQYE